MIRGLKFLLAFAIAARGSRLVGVEEHSADSRGAPRVIYDALGGATKVVQDHLEILEEAQKLAEQRKSNTTKKIQEKNQVMKAVQAKTDKSATKAKASRDLMLKVEKAAAQHDQAGEEHKKSMSKFGKVSDDLDELARKITLKEQALRQVVKTYKQQIANLKALFDAKSKEKDQAEREMMTLKTQAATAGKFKTDVQQEQAKAEQEMQHAQQALDAARGELDSAVSAATVAEAMEQKAVNEARAANAKVDTAKKTKDYLLKVKKAVDKYYKSIDDFEAAVEGQTKIDIKKVPEAKTTLENYNSMVNAFVDLHSYDSEVYGKVTPAIKEVKDNAFGQIRFVCDLLGAKTTDKEHCLSGLWEDLEMTKREFPA